MRLTACVVAMEQRTPGRECPVCWEWQGSVLACVPSEEADAPDAWQRHLPHPETCPRCARVVIREVKVLIGVAWDKL